MEEKINGILNIFFYKKIKDMNEKKDKIGEERKKIQKWNNIWSVCCVSEFLAIMTNTCNVVAKKKKRSRFNSFLS